MKPHSLLPNFTHFITATLLAFMPLYAWAQATEQSLEEVEQFALEYVKQKADQKLFEPKFDMRSTSRSVKLPKCQTSLEIIDRDPAQFAGRMAIGVSCPEPFWKLFIPFKVDGFVEVVKTAQGILRNTVIQKQMLSVERVHYKQLNRNAIIDINTAIGMRSKRALAANRILQIKDLQPPYLVFKNKPVTLVTYIGAIEVKTQGIALDNATQDQVVSVQNLKSSNVVRGIVIAPNLVKVP